MLGFVSKGCLRPGPTRNRASASLGTSTGSARFETPRDFEAMQLYPSDHDPLPNARAVCRQSRAVAMCGLVVWTGLCLGITLAILPVLSTWPQILLTMTAWAVFRTLAAPLLATLRKTNWTLAWGPDGIWVNLRSHQNYRFEVADTIVHLPYDEIESAAKYVAKRSMETSDGPLTWSEVSLDLKLKSADSGPLRKAIAQERTRRVTRSLCRGWITTSGRSNHVPVTLPADEVLRIAWKSRSDWLRPGLDTVLESLAFQLNVPPRPAAEAESSLAAPDWDRATDHELDEEILRTVETGDTFAAIRLLRQRHGYSTTQAKQFVDELTERLASAGL